MRFGDLIASRANCFGDKTAVIYKGKEYSYSQLDKNADSVAAFLHSTGTGLGSHVIYIAYNSEMYFEILTACSRIGAIFTPISWRLCINDITKLVDATDAKVIFASRSFLEAIEAEGFCPGERHKIVVLDDEYENCIPYRKCLDYAPMETAAGGSGDRCLMQIYTSGTTSVPKGVMLSDEAVCSHALGHLSDIGERYDCVFVCVLPLFHASSSGSLATLLAGATVVVLERFRPEEYLRTVERYRATALSLTPSMFSAVLNERRPNMNTLLKGVKVLDLTSFVAGPTSTQLMAYMGADIVKVEMPVCGDSGRGMLNMRIGHHSGNILQTNHGRKSIELDIQDPEGREVFKRLVKDYDVVLEGFRPGLMAKYGLDYENLKQVNPKLIYCSISTYGQTGPYSKRPGFDLIAQAEAGIINSTGDPNGPPQRIGTYLGDYVGAQSVLSAVCAALYHREVSGEGQYLDVSLYESLAYLSANVDVYSLFGLKNGRTGNHMFNSAPYGLFEGAGKRYIAICAPTPPIWKNLCIAMKREDLLENERYSDMSKRIENRYELVDIIQAWLSEYENAGDAIEILRAHDVPCAEVKADWEMHECPQLASRHYFEDIPFPKSVVEETGRTQYKIKGLPFKSSCDAVNPDYLPLPEVGEHNYDVYGTVASKEEIDEMLSRWHGKFKKY